MRERVVAMGKEEGKRNPVAQEGTRRYWPRLSLSRVLDLVVYRSTVQAEPDSRDKGRAVRVEKQYLQLALVITSRELKMVTE